MVITTPKYELISELLNACDEVVKLEAEYQANENVMFYPLRAVKVIANLERLTALARTEFKTAKPE